VLVGAAYNDAGGADAGAAYVVFGKATTTAINLDNIALGTDGFKIIGASAGALAGAMLTAAGDLNGDGRGDLVIGAPGADEASVLGRCVFIRAGATLAAFDLAGQPGGGRPAGRPGRAEATGRRNRQLWLVADKADPTADARAAGFAMPIAHGRIVKIEQRAKPKRNAAAQAHGSDGVGGHEGKPRRNRSNRGRKTAVQAR
jgi:hypothetical protein